MSAHQKPAPVDQEITFSPDEIIVSKTNLKGYITYANDVFCRVAEMSTIDVLGKPHNIIRHPDMPRAVFKFLWENLQNSTEVFAFIKNMSATGKYYWVIAHVTPTLDSSGTIIGYHSNRRCPSRQCIEEIIPLYQSLQAEENRHSSPKDGLDASYRLFLDTVAKESASYDEFIWKMVS